MINISKKKGSTLVEILLYFIILAIFLLAATVFAFQIIDVSDVSNTFSEMESNREFISEKISYAVQTAEGVSSTGSIFDNDNGMLVLFMTESASSPTQFYLSGGNTFIKEGSADAVQLNTNDVKIDYLRFNLVSYDKSPDQVIVDAGITPVSTQLAHLQKELLLHLTATLRQ